MKQIFALLPKADEDLIRKTIQLGGWLAICSAAITTILTLIAPPYWPLFDAALFAILGFFVLRKSRTASTLLLVSFVWHKIYPFIVYEVGKSAWEGLLVPEINSGTYIISFIWFIAFAAAAKSTKRCGVWESPRAKRGGGMRGRIPPPPRRNNTDPRHCWNHCWNLPIHAPILISFSRNNPSRSGRSRR